MKNQELLLCGEIVKGKISSITRELMNIGLKLCDSLNQSLSLLLIGSNIQEAASEAISFGAKTVYSADWAPYPESLPDISVSLISQVYKQIQPSVVLFSQTDMGRDIAPRLAARLKSNVCMDCVDLAVDSRTKSLLITKPVYGGNALAVWSPTNYKPQIITMRSRTADPIDADPTRKGKIISIATKITDSSTRCRLLETVYKEVEGIKLDEAKVIVTGGGGIGSQDGFQLIQELAHVLRGAIGISRVPCDEGWMPSNLEIGQTGHSVSPDLYIAIGISGAPQHLAGCSGSKCIVAINKDSEAHIFKVSDLGIVGDYKEILPPLIQRCKELKEG